MQDIARLANVSKTAVSLAFSGKPGISQATRNKIITIAQEAGYKPKISVPINSRLAASHIIRFVACTNSGIVSDQFNKQPFFMELIHEIELECRKRGCSLFFSAVPSDQLEDKITKLESEHKSDGIILLGTNLSKEQVRLVSEKQKNLIVLDTCFNTLDVNFIVMNNMMGSYQAAQHLIQLGHRIIGYVQSHDRMYNFESRKQGFLSALEEQGLSLAKAHTFSVSPTIVCSQADFKADISKLLPQLPTALFCECDYIAISVIKSLSELGIRIPEDVSVIGFDNIHESMVISPELTTVHVEKKKIAELAVINLLSMVEDPKHINMKTLLDTRLMIRNSCRSIVN